jgi:L-2-hydroxyglutarate oxidase LhgO
MSNIPYDAVIIGAGIYGCVIACQLAERFQLKKIIVIERESSLFQRASSINQARVHNGYHYPRSYTTAYRSRVNVPKFVADWPSAIERDFSKVYGIAKHNSKVTSKQFVRFCNEIGAKIKPATPLVKNLFNDRLIEDLFEVEEYAFNSSELASLCWKNLTRNEIEVQLQVTACSIQKEGKLLSLSIKDEANNNRALLTRKIFNCAYSGLNTICGDFSATQTKLKHEITEMALIEPPAPLENLAFTIMDGPFFSVMPFPTRSLHTLSHVRYTPHYSFPDQPGRSPYKVLYNYPKQSRANRMLRDASRYLPSLSEAHYQESLFEIKTTLMKNETDDGRPILFEESKELPGLFSVLGGKIDNIYDILERMDACLSA